MCETTNVICRCALEYLKRLTVPHTCFAKSLCPLCAFARLSTGKKDRRPAGQGQTSTGRHVFNAFFSPEIRVIDKVRVSASSSSWRREYSRHFVSTCFMSKDVRFKSRSDHEKH